MAYIMDSGQKSLYTTFPNIISWESAILADLSKKNEIYHISEKKVIFNSKDRPRNVKSGLIGKPR